MIDADIRIEDPRWGDEADLDVTVAQALAAILAELDGKASGAVAILFTDDEAQRILNLEHRHIDKPTNVLSFPAGDTPLPPGIPRPLGDLSLAYETVACEAQAGGMDMTAHLQHLIIHGFLHLLGYDHENDTEASIMEMTETRALARLGIADPYGAQQV
jgi:probable rRNA maturation factor